MHNSSPPQRIDLPMEPLQCLPQQPLKHPMGARLVLCNRDAGYPDRPDPSSPGRGQWFENIAGTDTKSFLQIGNHYPNLRNVRPEWK